MRLLPRSATNRRPAESIASACGKANSSGPLPRLPHAAMKLAFLGELHDPRIGGTAMAVADEDIAIGGDKHIRRSIERVGTGAGNAGLAKGHEHLALWAELEHSVPLALTAMIVGRPDIAVMIDMQP